MWQNKTQNQCMLHSKFSQCLDRKVLTESSNEQHCEKSIEKLENELSRINCIKTNCYQSNINYQKYQHSDECYSIGMLFDGAAINIIKFSKIINIKQRKEKEFFMIIIDTLLISIQLFFVNKR